MLEDEAPELLVTLRKREDELISFGAHPNLMGVEPMLTYEMEEGANHGRMLLRYLSNEQDRVVAWHFSADTADLVLRVFVLIFPVRADLALVPNRLNSLARERLRLIQKTRASLDHPDLSR